MARRVTPNEPPLRPVLNVEQKRRAIERLRRRIQDINAFDPQTVNERWSAEVTALEAGIDEALSAAFGHGTVEYKRYVGAATLDNGPVVMSMGHRDVHREAYEAREYLSEGKRASIVMLEQAIKFLEEEIAEGEHDLQSVETTAPKLSSRKVFVVHGHDHGARDAVARFLEKIELKAIILQEQPDQGLTIIEKFESYASQVGFAVVLMTPDDLGGPAASNTQVSRARQNVIFELGYFVGKLGRGRACLLRKGNVEIPSDLYGVIYTEMDAADGWKLKLVKEMKASNLSFDANKMWS